MSRALVLASILSVATNNAQAVECQASLSGGDSYWAWRLIDGRKCWYKGAPGMAKSLLHWPVEGRLEKAVAMEPLWIMQTRESPKAQAIPSEVLLDLPRQPTFEDRWRLR
jgi:hypothetical protein